MLYNFSAIMLAAGLSSRMGQDKLLLSYRDKTLLESAATLLWGLPCREKILVTTRERLATISLPDNIAVVINQNPQFGQSESLRLGLLAAMGGEGFVFLTADQPNLTPADLEPLFLLAAKNPGRIIYPSAAGRGGSPVFFPASFREKLMAVRGDAGGRAVRLAHPDLALTFEADPEIFADVDSPDDYTKLTNDGKVGV